METSAIGNALFTKTQQKVLALLYGQPGKSFYLNEIIRLAEMGKGSIKRELERMQAAGLLTLTHIGNQNHYQANRRCPVYDDLQGIVRKTFGITNTIRNALIQFDSQIDFSFVFGSIAKGNETANSDIDLMVVTDTLAYAELMAVFPDVEQLLGRPVNPTIYNIKQLKKKLKAKNVFLTRVMDLPKLWIKGGQDDIGRVR